MFPSILKGSDLYLYCVFVALGLEVQIRAVLDNDDDEDYEERYEASETSCGGYDVWVSNFRCGTGAFATDTGGDESVPIEEAFAEFGHQEGVHWINGPDPSTREVGFYHLAVCIHPLFCFCCVCWWM